MRFFAAVRGEDRVVSMIDLSDIHPTQTFGQARTLAETAFGAENVVEVFCDSSKDITQLLRDVFYSGARHHGQVFPVAADSGAKTLAR